MNGSFGRLFRSFGCALRGLWACLRTERNLRIHFTAAALVLWLSGYYEFSAAEYAVLILTIGVVIAAELLNTALEVLTDLVSADHHPLAGMAKDAAAAGVLISAIASVGVGVVLFWRPDVLRGIVAAIAADPFRALPPAAIAAVGFAAAFLLPSGRKNSYPEANG